MTDPSPITFESIAQAYLSDPRLKASDWFSHGVWDATHEALLSAQDIEQDYTTRIRKLFHAVIEAGGASALFLSLMHCSNHVVNKAFGDDQ